MPIAEVGPHGVAAVLRPLVSGLTYRRWVHLLLSGVLALPYVLLAGLFWTAIHRAGNPDPVSLVILGVITAVLAVLIALIPAVRVLEVAAARALLGVDLPDPTPEDAAAWATRWRSAGWFVLNLLLGATFTLVVLIVAPTAVGLAWLPFGGARPVTFGEGLSWDAPVGWVAAWVPFAAVGAVLGLLYLGAGVGALLARWAPVVLGPSAAAELAQARRQVQRLTERNRLARELHDSVGHALTVTTLQAGAAARVLDSDPAFARRALEAIAETGRTALEELDQVLGMLRDGVGERTAQPDLADLPGLLAGARAAGVPVHAEVVGNTRAVPPAVSREAYRIAQEALTNALRHAGPVPVAVGVVVGPDELSLEVTNPAGTAAARPGGGRGLAGMAERVEALRGDLVAGPSGDGWRVAARLPLRSEAESVP